MVKIDENIQKGKKVVVKKQTLFTRFLVTLFLMLGVFVVAAVITYLPTLSKKRNITKNFEWCVTNGGTVDKNTYPTVCNSRDGMKFIKPASTEEQKLLESPAKVNSDAENKFCGGIANIQCPDGYRCVLEGSYPDAGGKCTKK